MKETTPQYPEFIKSFPKVKFPQGLKGNSNLLSAPEGQVVFHTITKGQAVPLHQHDDSWAILVSGKLEYTLGSDQFTATTGQSWFIPSSTLHGGEALENSLLVEVFCENRWSKV